MWNTEEEDLNSMAINASVHVVVAVQGNEFMHFKESSLQTEALYIFRSHPSAPLMAVPCLTQAPLFPH